MQGAMARRNSSVDEAERVQVQLGINLGDIILDGDDIDGDDIFGDGVNVAARLEATAEPGGICVSGTVCEHVRNKVNAEF